MLLAISLVVGTGSVSSARPSKADLDAAKAKLDRLNRSLDQLVEQYDQARIRLGSAQRDLVQARKDDARAQTERDAAQRLLSARAAEAYEGTGSALEALLGATSLADFSDRLEFVNRLAQQDADIASRAEVKRQESLRAQDRLNSAVSRQQQALRDIRSRTAEIKSGIAQQEALVKQIEQELAKPLYPKPTKPASLPGPPRGGTSGGGGPGPSPSPSPTPAPPPDPGSGAQIAVQAAFSVIGVPYHWGGSDPSTGFDCSGLTMWAWAQAGVSLPHSSAAQYDMLPHVSRDQLAPGDLVFFYTPVSHVGIYVGGGMMIHAPHTGGYVEEVSLDSEPDYVGAGRPG